ncbi:MAG TPA: glycosyltransferase family 39 protein [Galbitalea sp.]
MIETGSQRLVAAPPSRPRGRVIGERAPAPRPTRRRRGWVDPLWLGVVATLVVSIGSWIPSKWSDEVATQSAASRSVGQLWQMMQNVDAVHGAYYLFMHFWIIGFGTSNFALRAPSMMAVGIACAGVAVLGHRLGGRRLAVLGGLVFAILPRVTWMGMEARSLAFTAAVAVWLTVILLKAIERRAVSWWAIYAGLGALAVVLNIYLALLIVAHGVAIALARGRLERPRRLLLGWATGALIAAAVSFPIDRLTMGQTGQLPKTPLTPTGTLDTLLFAQYFSGATPTVARSVPFPPTGLWSAAVIIAAILGWSLILAPLAWRRLRPIPPRRLPISPLQLLLPWAVLPIVLVITYSAIVHPMYSARYFSFTTPAIALLIASPLARIRIPWMRVAAVAMVAVVVLPVYIAQRGPTAKNGTDWQQAAAILQAHAAPGQDIYYGPVRSHSLVSMRKLRDAYPAVLDQLHDISLRTTGAQSATLWGTHWSLNTENATLRTTPVLWAVIEHSGTPSKTTAQERYIETQGLRMVHIWRGSMTDVVEFER